MKYENELALIIAYYLSKFNDSAYSRLNMGSKTKTHESVGKILGVNPNTVKNMRDAFDPIHENNRVGWYQSDLAPSRVKVVEMFGVLTENALYEVVNEILVNRELNEQEDLKEALDNIQKKENKTKKNCVCTTRGITGKKAENYFIKNYREIFDDKDAALIDKRDDGCGYDFIIKTSKHECYAEIKGLCSNNGGILLTDKEWSMAEKYKAEYNLVLIKNLDSENIEFLKINDPFNNLRPQRAITTVIQVNWQVSEKELYRSGCEVITLGFNEQ